MKGWKVKSCLLMCYPDSQASEYIYIWQENLDLPVGFGRLSNLIANLPRFNFLYCNPYKINYQTVLMTIIYGGPAPKS